jgi:hypothetical protein
MDVFFRITQGIQLSHRRWRYSSTTPHNSNSSGDSSRGLTLPPSPANPHNTYYLFLIISYLKLINIFIDSYHI